MSTTAEQVRAWNGPAVLSFGFRPFFLGGAVWAAVAMALWVPMLSGQLSLPTAFDPVSWHAHEFLFGYLGAIIAGFLMTAVPNWTGRMPVVGWPLAGLFGLWLAGRVAVAFSSALPLPVVVAADLAMPVVLAAFIAREIAAGRNWRNLPVLAGLAMLIAGNGIFHWEAASGTYAAQGYGFRLGLAAALMMIALVGGRIVPSFTRNWLVKRGKSALPAPPMQWFDKLALAALLVALLLWIVRPQTETVGVLLVLAGILQLVRLVRWRGERTGREPLVWVLHAGYLFLPLGALGLGAGLILPGAVGMAAAQHLWMAGAIGVMTLAVMTRASLGHTGRPLTAGSGTLTLYLLLIASTLARFAAGLYPEHAVWLYDAAGMAWLAAFAGFAVLYGPLLLRR